MERGFTTKIARRRARGPFRAGAFTPHHQREVGMTRTDVVASSRPRRTIAAPKRKGTSSALRKLVVLPVALALMAVAPATALAAEDLSGYGKTTTTTTTTTTPPSTST